MRIALHGTGRMGRAVQEMAASRGHVLHQQFDRSNPLPDVLTGADVLIDFSHADAIERLFEVTCRSRVPVVTGTTGWNDRMATIRSMVDDAGTGAVYASNFSVGANALFALARHAGGLLGGHPQYSSGIEERHHDQKKDAPSGTAIRLGAVVREGSDGRFDPAIVSSRVGREPGLHTLFFDSEDDLIEISHRARGRQGFARGAVLAAELLGERRGLIAFEELLGL